MPTTLAVDSDPVLLERILRNLVANALRYTRAGGVVVGARRRGAAVRIDVVDSGVGIAPEFRERIFDEFVQGGVAPKSHVGGRGMGLGLAIVRRLAALLGHSARRWRRSPGRGSRFSVTAPRAAVRRRRGGETRSRRVAAGSGAPATAFAGRRVAVIDDDPGGGRRHAGAVLGLGRGRRRRRQRGRGRRRPGGGVGPRRGGTPRPDLIVADLRLAAGSCGLDAVAQLRAAAAGDRRR